MCAILIIINERLFAEGKMCMLTYGSIRIDFVTETSKEEILESFDDLLIRVGAVNLVSIDNNKKLKLEISEHEFIKLVEHERL